MAVTLLIPALDEAKALPALVAHVAALDPQPAEVLLVDGGSGDETVAIARDAGWRVMTAQRGRARQINAGVEVARSELVCVLHADTEPPRDIVAEVERMLADPEVALGGFTTILRGPGGVRRFTSFHNRIKTWYAPLLLRPHLYAQGVRLLFGDHAMHFRRADYLAAGGCDPGTPVMEEADLCIRMARFGRVRLNPRKIYTSDRRVAEWGELKANWIYFKVGIMWAFGARARLAQHYPDIR